MRLVSTMNQLNSAKKWLQHASNQGTRSMNVTNGAFFWGDVPYNPSRNVLLNRNIVP